MGKWGATVCKAHDIKIWPWTFAFQKGSNIIVSPPPCLNLREYKRSEKKVIMSTPQSCTSLVRNIPLKISLRKLHMICHQSLFTTSNTKQFQKVALNGWSPHPQSCQYLILDPYLTSYLTNLEIKRKKKKKTHAHPFGPNKLIGTPSSPHAIILVSREFNETSFRVNETSFRVKSLYVQISLSLDGSVQ
jgi:hypothetical protein